MSKYMIIYVIVVSLWIIFLLSLLYVLPHGVPVPSWVIKSIMAGDFLICIFALPLLG